MNIRYPTALVLTSLVVLTTAAVPAPRHLPPGWTGSQLYSARALRRARIILELKLLELRKAKLERVRKALEQNRPIDRILRMPP